MEEYLRSSSASQHRSSSSSGGTDYRPDHHRGDRWWQPDNNDDDDGDDISRPMEGTNSLSCSRTELAVVSRTCSFHLHGIHFCLCVTCRRTSWRMCNYCVRQQLHTFSLIHTGNNLIEVRTFNTVDERSWQAVLTVSSHLWHTLSYSRSTPCPWKNGPPKQNAVKCTVYNTIHWHLHSII